LLTWLRSRDLAGHRTWPSSLRRWRSAARSNARPAGPSASSSRPPAATHHHRRRPPARRPQGSPRPYSRPTSWALTCHT